MCISPVDRAEPRRGAIERRRRGPARARRARAPSRRALSGTNCCIMPSVASSGSPRYSYHPSSAASMREAVRARKRSSSSSGFSPASIRRKAFMISASSKTTEEFDCSRRWRSGPRGVGAERGVVRAAEARRRPAVPDDRAGGASVGRGCAVCSVSAARRRRSHRRGCRSARARRARGHADQQLVELVCPGVGAALDDQHKQRRLALADRRSRRCIVTGRGRGPCRRTSAARDPSPSRSSDSGGAPARASAVSSPLRTRHGRPPLSRGTRRSRAVPA